MFPTVGVQEVAQVPWSRNLFIRLFSLVVVKAACLLHPKIYKSTGLAPVLKGQYAYIHKEGMVTVSFGWDGKDIDAVGLTH
jgi:hypothetical protein